MCNVILMRVRSNHCCSGKAIGITYSECVFVSLIMQHAMPMRHIVSGGLSGSTVYSTYHKWHDFRIKVIGLIMCVPVFSTSFVWNISNSKKK